MSSGPGRAGQMGYCVVLYCFGRSEEEEEEEEEEEKEIKKKVDFT